ncbi:MAG: PIN domain-containing protein [Bacteroidetes bacterium]|nr:PIN domain-containing protein [Bacteroidota bacterium]MBL7103398.1 PIN domain-containing protein [Bacteroidales bacterium]
MRVLVDTCVWSDALRKVNFKADDPIVKELKELIREGRVQMIGPIRQEILSGIRSQVQYDTLRSYLNSFPDLTLQAQDFEKAAEFYNLNRRKGIQGSNTDFLICAVASRYKISILTTDHDFNLFRENITIKLHTSRFSN